MSPAVVHPMSPAAAALMRPAGVVPVLASHPAAGLPDPAVALAPRVAVLEVLVDSAVGRVAVLEVPVDSAVGRVAVLEDPVDSVVGRVAAASVEAGATDGDLRTALPRLRGRRDVSVFRGLGDGLLARTEPDARAQKLLRIDGIAVDPCR